MCWDYGKHMLLANKWWELHSFCFPITSQSLDPDTISDARILVLLLVRESCVAGRLHK